nr:MAG TPA_asm: hypothetical protein [Caudoviricetes sp.]
MGEGLQPTERSWAGLESSCQDFLTFKGGRDSTRD